MNLLAFLDEFYNHVGCLLCDSDYLLVLMTFFAVNQPYEQHAHSYFFASLPPICLYCIASSPTIVLDLKPRLAITLIPTLPAYVLFMCLRHTDYLNEDARCKSLLTSTISGIKKVAKVCDTRSL